MRYKFDKIEERDVDFVVMRALCEIPEFVGCFLRRTNWKDAVVISVEHSYMDIRLGESDITVVVEFNNKKYGLLIENKIDAKAMNEQCQRYRTRGELGISKGEYEDYALFIIAPDNYIKTNVEAQKYDNKITYEELLVIFEKNGRFFDKQVIECAINKQVNGYTVQEVPAITCFWNDLYEFCSRINKEIEMYPVKGPKGFRSRWIQFKTNLKGTTLYYKSREGVVDLEFNGKQRDFNQLRNEINEFREDDMHWVQTGKTISLRIKVKPMNFENSISDYTKELEIMIDAVEKLTKFSVKLNDSGYMV